MYVCMYVCMLACVPVVHVSVCDSMRLCMYIDR